MWLTLELSFFPPFSELLLNFSVSFSFILFFLDYSATFSSIGFLRVCFPIIFLVNKSVVMHLAKERKLPSWEQETLELWGERSWASKTYCCLVNISLDDGGHSYKQSLRWPCCTLTVQSAYLVLNNLKNEISLTLRTENCMKRSYCITWWVL